MAKLAVTHVRQLRVPIGASGVLLGLGAGASLDHVPAAFEAAYGRRWPYGFVLFVSVRPAAMSMPMPMPARTGADAKGHDEM